MTRFTTLHQVETSSPVESRQDDRGRYATWYCLAATEVVRRLGSDIKVGLDEKTAQARATTYGPNELPEPERRGLGHILWEQLTAFMVVVLLAAAAVSLTLGHYKDASVVFAIVLLNVGLGLAQDYRAEKAMHALRRLAAPLVKVRRGGLLHLAPARDLVPGDLVVLETGDILSADCRVLEARGLQLNEASLTGESTPMPKTSQSLPEEVAMLPEQKNMVWCGTSVVSGRGLGVVTATGKHTELGRIASLLGSVRRETTALQRRLDELGRWLFATISVLVAIIFFSGLLRGESVPVMLLTAISMAVAALPEGLPAVITITLALGAQRMLRRHALIRRLSAAEGLGSVTVICSDKTGTLTENRMAVTSLKPLGGQDHAAGSPPGFPTPGEMWLLIAATLCNDSRVSSGVPKSIRLDGDPMEVALASAARSHGLEKSVLDLAFPRVSEIPFDNLRKRMTTLHRRSGAVPILLRPPALQIEGDGQIAFMKGAWEHVLEVCDQQQVGAVKCQLDAGARERVWATGEQMARTGARVIGCAYRAMGVGDESPIREKGFVFLGLIGLSDPIRPEVQPAVDSCRAAGIRPIIITGDHPYTAQHVAEELGIGGSVLTGRDLDRMSSERLRSLVNGTSIFARVLPEHKSRIVRALQDGGHVVAMTGDGVNDATALKQADIGVAMGQSGTDVAKQAADLVLLDDQFATIVAAVKEGRTIYDNVRKFIRYILAGNLAELFVMLIGPFFGLSLPLLPLQILWINLMTDGFIGLGFSVEKSESDAMRRPPRAPTESIFAGGMVRHIFVVGLSLGILSLGIGVWMRAHDSAAWRTAIFLTLALGQTFQAVAASCWRESIFRRGLLTNPTLIAAVILSAFSTLLITYLPILQTYFGVHALSTLELLAVLFLSTVVFSGIEIEKRCARGVSTSCAS